MTFELGNISAIRDVQTRSISPENRDGSKSGGGRAIEGTGARYAADLGQGWKISPSLRIEPGETLTLASIDEPGKITHIWMTTSVGDRTSLGDGWRALILRAYWDGADEPAIEVPVGDFFCNGWGEFAQVSSAVIAANPYGGFNSYWPMPFRTSARITLENLAEQPAIAFFQITYETGGDVANSGYLHAQFHRSNPLEAGAVHPILSGVEGMGHYVGTYLAWGVNSPSWWGEGEMKFYLDGDLDEGFPTICGTGTEDYFGGAYDFAVPGQGYTRYSTPYLGLPQVLPPDGLYKSQQRFGLYRWHLADPIHFRQDLTVNVQALGFTSSRTNSERRRYQPRWDDIASTALFYLDRPTAMRPELPSAEALEVLF